MGGGAGGGARHGHRGAPAAAVVQAGNSGGDRGGGALPWHRWSPSPPPPSAAATPSPPRGSAPRAQRRRRGAAAAPAAAGRAGRRRPISGRHGGRRGWQHGRQPPPWGPKSRGRCRVAPRGIPRCSLLQDSHRLPDGCNRIHFLLATCWFCRIFMLIRCFQQAIHRKLAGALAHRMRKRCAARAVLLRHDKSSPKRSGLQRVHQSEAVMENQKQT